MNHPLEYICNESSIFELPQASGEVIALGLFGNRWVAVRTESGTRADDIDRLYALFKSNGLKSKITSEGSTLKRISVLKKDTERAKELIDAFDKER